MKNLFKKIYQWLTKPLLWRIQEIKDQQSYALDRMDVLNSSLWDENYYFISYKKDILNSKLTPLDHYLQIGWKSGFNPSERFDNNDYLSRYPFVKINPLVFFLSRGRFMGNNNAFSKNVYKVSEDQIKSYLQFSENRTTNKVVYTCITNDYDDLNQIVGYTYIDNSWDYVCFTDNAKLINQKQFGIWKIRPLYNNSLDAVRGNRFHKILPHIVLPEYSQSLYVDANINITTPYIFEQIEKLGAKIILPTHFCSNCLYQESQWIQQKGLDKIDDLIKLIRNDGFPENYGFCENNIIFRQHKDPQIIEMMNLWWDFVKNYCRRDQASFMYVLWKNGIKPDSSMTINNSRVDYNNFCRFNHVKPRDY